MFKKLSSSDKSTKIADASSPGHFGASSHSSIDNCLRQKDLLNFRNSKHEYISLSWNIEGLKRNIFSLKLFSEKYNPDFVFLSEPNIFTVDTDNLMRHFGGDYSWYVNAKDLFDIELPMVQSRTF